MKNRGATSRDKQGDSLTLVGAVPAGRKGNLKTAKTSHKKSKPSKDTMAVVPYGNNKPITDVMAVVPYDEKRPVIFTSYHTGSLATDNTMVTGARGDNFTMATTPVTQDMLSGDNVVITLDAQCFKVTDVDRSSSYRQVAWPDHMTTPLPMATVYPKEASSKGSTGMEDYTGILSLSAPAIPISPMLSTCCCFQYRYGHRP